MLSEHKNKKNCFIKMQAEKKAAEERIANAEYEVEAISKARDVLKEELRKQKIELDDYTRGLTESESVRSNFEADNLKLKKHIEVKAFVFFSWETP